MEEIRRQLEERESFLIRLQEEKKSSLASAPPGSLRVSSHNGRAQYYQRNDPKDFNGTYIRAENASFVEKLAQKDYDKKVLRSIEQELKAIKLYLSSYPQICAEQVIEYMHPDRRKLIRPIRETDEVYIGKWGEISYEGKAFSEDMPEYYTSKGERVRSKSEVLIADQLSKLGVPYKYECPVELKGVGVVYPDFTVLNKVQRKEMYWEHLGMMDDISYVEGAMRKITAYEQNKIFPGEKLILTHETRKRPLNLQMIMRNIQCYLQ